MKECVKIISRGCQFILDPVRCVCETGLKVHLLAFSHGLHQ